MANSSGAMRRDHRPNSKEETKGAVLTTGELLANEEHRSLIRSEDREILLGIFDGVLALAEGLSRPVEHDTSESDALGHGVNASG